MDAVNVIHRLNTTRLTGVRSATVTRRGALGRLALPKQVGATAKPTTLVGCVTPVLQMATMLMAVETADRAAALTPEARVILVQIPLDNVVASWGGLDSSVINALKTTI
jgi:hypothetical protein